jgi:aerobic-type carbon monoxide dehydrogenase small subunit (CoxS/CutS family)
MPEHAHIDLTVNGEPLEVAFAPYKTLLEVLREDLNLCGTKHGCELGECGACAVLLDGLPVLSCLVLGVECAGRSVTTVEGLACDGRLHPLQDAFADLGAAQCGYCTPGFLVTAKALLDEHPNPTRDQIREALAGNLCRCTGYQQIFEAVESAISAEREALSPHPKAATASGRGTREKESAPAAMPAAASAKREAGAMAPASGGRAPREGKRACGHASGREREARGGRDGIRERGWGPARK